LLRHATSALSHGRRLVEDTSLLTPICPPHSADAKEQDGGDQSDAHKNTNDNACDRTATETTTLVVIIVARVACARWKGSNGRCVKSQGSGEFRKFDAFTALLNISLVATDISVITTLLGAVGAETNGAIAKTAILVLVGFSVYT
jgi:hypothetical protein